MRFFYFIFICLIFIACSPINKYLRQANRKTEKGDVDAARALYLKAFQLDSNNLKANAGLGITLAEYMGRYDEALPYLQKAEKLSTKDTLPELFYCLGKAINTKKSLIKQL